MNRIQPTRVRPYRQHGRTPVSFERSTPFYKRHPLATFVVGVVAGVTSLGVLSKFTEVNADCSGPTRDYTVEYGDTLSGLANDIEGASELSRDDVIENIRELNPKIVGYTILAGQNLVLPEECRAD